MLPFVRSGQDSSLRIISFPPRYGIIRYQKSANDTTSHDTWRLSGDR